MAKPLLFYVSPTEREHRYLMSSSIVWNTFDGNHRDVESWNRLFDKRARLASARKPPEGILLGDDVCADFLPACRKTFAIGKTLWKKLKKRLSETVETIPISILREAPFDRFDFPKLPKKKQLDLVLLRSLANVPIRHGQRGFWDTKNLCFDMGLSKNWGATDPEATKSLFLDPEEFFGWEFFTIDGEWVASESFVEWYEHLELNGLSFHQLDYAVRKRPPRLKLKKKMPEPPEVELEKSSTFNEKLAGQWMKKWDWTVECLRNRKWGPKKVRIKPPLQPDLVRRFEKRFGIELPKDFFDVITKLGRSATIDLGGVDVSHPAYPDWDEFSRAMPNLMFGHQLELWSFDTVKKEYGPYSDWSNTLDQFDESDYDTHYLNKLPIHMIGNGDIVALDLESGIPTYLSHDGDADLQGASLANSFVDLISRWTEAGLPWLDFIPSTPFYDHRKRIISTDNDYVTRLHHWLRGFSGEDDDSI
ncbi:MAG: SMI1/KNR4 family protein [Planctomycetales bacterium]|nr:SMI1/KNR4 family protein [Planctomycetales bacterium]